MNLNTKIPPPLLLLISLALMYALAKYIHFDYLNLAEFVSDNSRYFVAGLISSAGFLLMIAGVLAFKKAKTTVNPLKPEQASQLVVSGVYRFTRNPMYLGMVFLLLAWGFILLSLLALLMLPLFVLYIYFFQIRAEEAAMEKLFGDDYIVYKKQVRRWL